MEAVIAGRMLDREYIFLQKKTKNVDYHEYVWHISVTHVLFLCLIVLPKPIQLHAHSLFGFVA